MSWKTFIQVCNGLLCKYIKHVRYSMYPEGIRREWDVSGTLSLFNNKLLGMNINQTEGIT